MPALRNVFLAHANAHTRAGLVACHSRGQKIFAVHTRACFSNGDQRRQNDGTHVHHTLAVHIVQLKTLYLCAIDQGGVRR